MTAEQAYAEVERIDAPSLAYGSVAGGKPCFPHEPPSFELRLAVRAAEIAANGEEKARGNLPVSPGGPFPTARQARWTPWQR
jgi:hypothetical protein